MSTRRSVLAGAAIAAAGALAAPALAQARTEWRMVTAWPKDLPGAGIGAQRLADRIGILTEGRLIVGLHPVGDLVPGQQNMDAVSEGRVEMAHDMASYYLARSPAFAFFSAVPFGLVASEHNAWVEFGGGRPLWDELGRRFGLKAFLAGNTGGQLGGWFRKEIASVGDLKGLRFRIPGLAGQALAKLGVSQVLMPGNAILEALRADELDAVEFMGPVNDAPFNFHQAAKICYWPGFQDPCAAFQLQVNADRFESLPKAQQAAIEAACAEENGRCLAEYNARTPAVLADLLAKGVEFKQFPPDVFKAFGRAAGEVLAEIVETGDNLVKRIASSYFAFRSETLLWTRIGDQGFANMRLLDYDYPKGA
jgi:TRAP-type mannitol/chloroaromatic compound transport system substrate-binding protein